MERTFYLAKEPDLGVLNDLSRISGEVIVVDCLGAYDDIYGKKGYNAINIEKFFELDQTMLFDSLLGNPPFQSNNGNGDLSGSGTGALWWKIVQKSISLLKPGGTIHIITPTNILNGGDVYTSLVLGPNRKLDLKEVTTSVNQYFPNVGTDICLWKATNSVTSGNKCIVKGKDVFTIETEKTIKIYDTSMMHGIMQTMFEYSGDKLNLTLQDTADARLVTKKLIKDGVDKETAEKRARDWKEVKDDEYCYEYVKNGKRVFSSVEWKTHGQWKVMIPVMFRPMKYDVYCSKDLVGDQSMLTAVHVNQESAEKMKEILDNPIYRWIIEQTRVGGRISGYIGNFPNAPIEEVLSEDQLSYIKSQL